MKQKKACITGHLGLTGGEMTKILTEEGWVVYGIDANIREVLFGKEGSTADNLKHVNHPNLKQFKIDIRDRQKIYDFFKENGPFDFIVHAAAQPSHTYAVDESEIDFDINTVGTFNMLQAYRKYSSESVFVYVSSSKVSGNTVNSLPLIEMPTRFDLGYGHEYYWGVDENFCRIDGKLKSPFGATKCCGDVLAQEYMNYYSLPIGIFRPVCISGSLHKGVSWHGFLAYVARCVAEGITYQTLAHRGKQLRDNIHAYDLCQAFYEFYKNPKPDTYNIGAGRESCCSVIEALQDASNILNREFKVEHLDDERLGDHLFCLYSSNKFKREYPNWKITYNRAKLMKEICSQYIQ